MDNEYPQAPTDEREDTFLRNVHRLFFNPRDYYAGITSPRSQGRLYLFAFIYSLAAAIDRGSLNSLGGKAPEASWATYWGALFGAALLGMLIVLWLGGAWYGFRLGLCGAETSDRALIKKVYLSAAQIYALPTVALALISSLSFKNPAAAAIGEPSWVIWVGLFFALWSYWGSYVGVRTVFRVRKGPAAALFLVLPVGFMVLVVGGSFWVARAGIVDFSEAYDYSVPASDAPDFSLPTWQAPSSQPETPALPAPSPALDVENAQLFENGLMTFSYPQGWQKVESSGGGAGPSIQVQTVGDAFVRLQYGELRASSEADVESWSLSVQKAYEGFAEKEIFSGWGDLQGAGRLLSGEVDGVPFDIRLFIAPIAAGRALLAMEMLPQAASDEVRAGLELVRRTFRYYEDMP